MSDYRLQITGVHLLYNTKFEYLGIEYIPQNAMGCLKGLHIVRILESSVNRLTAYIRIKFWGSHHAHVESSWKANLEKINKIFSTITNITFKGS